MDRGYLCGNGFVTRTHTSTTTAASASAARLGRAGPAVKRISED